jgi:hypothetical protein
MAETAVAEDSVPLLIKEEIDNLEKSEAVPERIMNSKSIFDFLYQRSTYIWIAFIAQFSQLVLQTIGFAVTSAKPLKNEENANNFTLFFASGLYSLFTFFVLTALVLPESKLRLKQPLNAGKRVNLTRTCAFMNLVNLFMILTPAVSKHGEQVYTDDILPIIIPLIFGFMVVATLASVTATWITYKAAKRSRGSEMVPDPSYLVPAWHLATTEEFQGLSRQSAIQLPC